MAKRKNKASKPSPTPAKKPASPSVTPKAKTKTEPRTTGGNGGFIRVTRID